MKCDRHLNCVSYSDAFRLSKFAFDGATGIVPRSNRFQPGLSKLTYFNSANIRFASTACVPDKFKSKARWREVLLSARFLR